MEIEIYSLFIIPTTYKYIKKKKREVCVFSHTQGGESENVRNFFARNSEYTKENEHTTQLNCLASLLPSNIHQTSSL